jgi:hypothetical protein
MSGNEEKLPPDKRSWLERPKNRPPDAGFWAVIGGAAMLVFMVYLAMHPPVLDLGLGDVKDLSGLSSLSTIPPEAVTQKPILKETPWVVKEISVTPTPTETTTTTISIQELGPIVLHPGSRVVAVTVDRRKYNQVFFYYTRNDNPSLEITSFKVEMMNAAGQYSYQVIQDPQKWVDTYLDQIRPSKGKDLVVVTATFNDGVVQTVLMNYV